MKHLFVGDERLLVRWLRELPDLANRLGSLMSWSDLDTIEESSLRSKLSGFSGDEVVLVDSQSSTNELGRRRLDGARLPWITIRDFVVRGLVDSSLMPRKLRLDASTICQLDCAGCYMRQSANGTMGRGYLRFEDFERLVETSPFLDEVELSNSGEMFLNPDLVRIMALAHRKGIRLTALNGVNFNRVSDKQLRALVEYEFGSLMVSIDGATQQVYSQYRRKGRFESVIRNLRRLIELRDEAGSKFPSIVWQYIIMAHNEVDVPVAKSLARELGVPIWFKLTWDRDYLPQDVRMLEKETGLTAFTRDDYLRLTGNTYLGTATCSQMFLSPQVNWDGRLLGCCEVFTHDYGVNVFEAGLREALCSPSFRAAKLFLLDAWSSESAVDELPCSTCDKWLLMKSVGGRLDPFESLDP